MFLPSLKGDKAMDKDVKITPEPLAKGMDADYREMVQLGGGAVRTGRGQRYYRLSAVGRRRGPRRDRSFALWAGLPAAIAPEPIPVPSPFQLCQALRPCCLC